MVPKKIKVVIQVAEGSLHPIDKVILSRQLPLREEPM